VNQRVALKSCFAERLGHLIALTPNEHDELARLEEKQRQLRRGAVLLREHEPANELFMLRHGMMMSSVLLDDGSRQILRILFPGDIIAGAALVYREAPETITALTDCTVCPFERAAMSRLVSEHPRLGSLILALNQVERTTLTDRLAGLGRTSAKARVAALLLELRNRMRSMDRGVTDSFSVGLTQEEMGDATGLTAVHVNRMLRQLEEEGLISRETGRVRLTNERALIRAANYVDRYEGLDLSWLPPAR